MQTELQLSHTAKIIPTSTESSAGSRIVFLDALRFIAAAAVVFQHSIEHEGTWGPDIVAALSPGVFGVVLFFIISGFVIPMAAKTRLVFRKFAISRLFRIYPLLISIYVILLALSYTGLIPSIALVKDASIKDWLANLFLIQDFVGATPIWGVTWTLNLEVAWYAVFALAFFVMGPRFDDGLSIAAPLILLSLIAISVLTGHRLPLARIGMIYAAILGARMYRHRVGLVGTERVLIDLATFMVVMALSNIVAFGYFKHPNITLNQALYPWIAAPILFAVVALVPAVRQGEFFKSAVIRWLGLISYSTYLLHPLAIAIAHDYSSGMPGVMLSIALTLALSVIGYYFIERPGQSIGRRLSSL